LFLMRRDLSAASSVMSEEGGGASRGGREREKKGRFLVFHPTRRNELFCFSSSSCGEAVRERQEERETK